MVWSALNDPEVLKRCLPGCESIDTVSPTEFAARLHVKVGPIAAKLSAKVHLQDMNPPHGYKLVSECNGGPVGMVSGTANVQLQTEGNDTLLQYQTSAKISGKLAQIGSCLIDDFANKTAEEFFARLNGILSKRVVATLQVAAVPADAHPEGREKANEGKGFLSWLLSPYRWSGVPALNPARPPAATPRPTGAPSATSCTSSP
jgi:carbon monoxide dehydrogenase subunit G